MLNDLNNLNANQRAKLQGELEGADAQLKAYMESESCYFHEYAEHKELLKELCRPILGYLREFGCSDDIIIITSGKVKHVSNIFEIELGDTE